MQRSIAEGRTTTPSPGSVAGSPSTRLVGLLIALAALALYVVSNPVHLNIYSHFVWQADAFLHGHAWFAYPVRDAVGQPDNWYFQDVYPIPGDGGGLAGRVLIPFPPLPAVVLMPFVAMFGLFTDQDAIVIGLAALGVWLAWWMLGRLTVGTGVRALTTIVFATGTVWWWAAAAGSTWYLAHLVAADLALVAVGVALGSDRRAVDEDPWDELEREAAAGGPAGAIAAAGAFRSGRLRNALGAWWPLDRSQVLAGFLLGLAATARLPMILAAPWLVLVGGGGSWKRRSASAAAGGVLPLAALLAYTFVTTGSLVHPGYDYQYQLEARGYTALGYDPAWSVEDPRYIPQNLGIMLGALPVVAPTINPDTLGFQAPVVLCVAPGAQRSLFDVSCPLIEPIDIGTSLLLSAPGLLIALFAIRRRSLARLTLGTVLAVSAIATFNLAHFSQGWVQWGYRFSLDFIPFLLPLIAIGAARADGHPRRTALVLLAAGAAVNVWGVTWGRILGW